MNLYFVFAMSIALIFSVNCSSSKNKFPVQNETNRGSGGPGSGIPAEQNNPDDPTGDTSPAPTPAPTPVALSGNEKIVDDAYLALFNRNAEQAGLDYWTDQIEDRGDDADAVISVLADIAINCQGDDRIRLLAEQDRIDEAIELIEEADKIFPGFLIDEFIHSLYNKYFNRDAENAGLNYWRDQYNRSNRVFSANLQFEADLLFGVQQGSVDAQSVLNDSLRRAWAEEIFDLVDATPTWYQ